MEYFEFDRETYDILSRTTRGIPWVMIAPEAYKNKGCPELLWLNQQILKEMVNFFIARSIYTYAPTVYNWTLDSQNYDCKQVFQREHVLWHISAGLIVLNLPTLEEDGPHKYFIDYYKEQSKPVYVLTRNQSVEKNFLNTKLSMEKLNEK